MLIEAMAVAINYDLPQDAAATRKALSRGAAVLARAGVEVPALRDWDAALDYLIEFLSAARVIRGEDAFSYVGAEAGALAQHDPVAALLPAATLVAQWEGSSARWLFSTRRGAVNWGWHGVVLPLARIMAGIPALWSARQLTGDAINGMRLSAGMDPATLPWYVTEALSGLRDLRKQLEGRYEGLRDRLASDIRRACRPPAAPIRSALAALWWTLGDPWHAHGIANASFEPTLSQVRGLTDQVLRRAYLDPMLSAVGARLWQGPCLRPERHESVRRRMGWYTPLSREYADFEGIRARTGVSPSNAYARALTSFFAGTSEAAERATITTLRPYVETFGGAAAIRFTALHLLLETVDGYQVQRRWHELAERAAAIASRLNYGQPYSYDRSFDLPLHYLEGDRDFLFRNLEHNRSASMEFVLRNIRPFPPTTPRSEALLAEENQLVTEIRFLRRGSRLPRLARPGEDPQSEHDPQLALADRLRRLDEVLGELTPVAPGYATAEAFRASRVGDLARAFGTGPPNLDR